MSKAGQTSHCCQLRRGAENDILWAADSRMLLTACDDMHAHLYDVEHASLIEAFSGESLQLCPAPSKAYSEYSLPTVSSKQA